MSIKDSQDDLEFLLNLFREGDPDRELTTILWLEARRFTSEEKQFLIQLLTFRLRKELKEWPNMFTMEKPLEEGKPLVQRPSVDIAHIDDYSKHYKRYGDEADTVFELAALIYGTLEVEPYPFLTNEIDPSFLVAPIRKELFVKAEGWFIRRYKMKDGKWPKEKPVSIVAGFIGALRDRQILITSNNAEMDQFFSSRYGLPSPMGDQIKYGKQSKDNKHRLTIGFGLDMAFRSSP